MALGFDSTTSEVLMFFTKSAQPARNGLQPGECSWADRVIAPNEPLCLRQKGVDLQVWWFVAGGPNAQQSYANSQQATWMRPMTDKNRTVVFQVSTIAGHPCFVVNSYAP